MSNVKRSVSITDQQHDWVKGQIEVGSFANESEVYRHLIRQAQEREERKIETLRVALIEAEESGFTNQTVSEIWAEARAGKV